MTDLLGLAAVAVMATPGLVASQENGSPPSPAIGDVTAGEALYGEYCASCHGVNLEGQPDWRSPGEDGRLPAPPHDDKGHTWHHADSMLFNYTKLGGTEFLAIQGLDFDSGMPAFGEDLGDEDIWNILAFIKSTWPERIRQIQAERTEFDNQRQGN